MSSHEWKRPRGQLADATSFLPCLYPLSILLASFLLFCVVQDLIPGNGEPIVGESSHHD